MRPPLKCLLLLLAVGLPLAPGWSRAVEGSPALAQAAPNQTQQAEADRLLEQGIQQYRVSQFRDALQSWQTAQQLIYAYSTSLKSQSEIDQLCAEGERLYRQGDRLYQGAKLFLVDEDGSEEFKGAVHNFLACLSQINSSHPDLASQDLSEGVNSQLLNIANYLQIVGFNLEDYGEYQLSLEALHSALNVYRLLQNKTSTASLESLRENEALTLNFLGWIYYSIGQYEKAIDFNQDSIEISQILGQPYGQQLADLGLTYRALGDHERSLEYAHQALDVAQGTNDRELEAFALSDIGSAHYDQRQFTEAIAFYQESIRVSPDPIHRWTIVSINKLGKAYQGMQDYEKAIEHHLQALQISRRTGFRAVEAQALSDLGDVMAAQGRKSVAVIFYKQAVSTVESIYQNSQGLSREEKQAYKETVSHTYRALTNLLLEQGRILEAQQVLELLKVEELREFTRASYTGGTLTYDPAEQPVVDAHGSLIAFGTAIAACDPNCPQTLYDQQIALERQYDQTVASFEQTVRQGRANDSVFYDPANLSSDALDLVNAQPGTVLIYPVVLEDRLWLLWTATGGVVGSVEVPVTQAELSRAALRFRELLERQDAQAYDEFRAVSQQLYGWLIAPLAPELEQNAIRHLIFAQDRTTRYLPMAALYDGSQYLLENYTVSTVLSAALTDTQGRLGNVASTTALGLGLTRAVTGFNPLPNVAAELTAAIRVEDNANQGIYPGQIFMDDAFTFEALSHNVRRANILHIATHAEFVPSTQGESYILSGTGQRLALADIGALDTQFRNLHLVVLSACQTALGGTTLDGTEIAGLSSYFLGRNKAKTVMATLWKVDDAGTSLLMQRFYALLATGELTTAEAMRQAQLSLLTGEATLDDRLTNLGVSRGFALVEPEGASVGLAHPYYWAPFILIGNPL